MVRDIDDLPKSKANYTALTPLWFLERAAAVHPNRKSIVHGSVSYTWRQTYERCCRLASALSRRSIGVGTTVKSLYLRVSCHLVDKFLYDTVVKTQKGLRHSTLFFKILMTIK